MGALAKGQKLGQIFTVLSLTQQAGIPFYRAWRAQKRPLKVSTGGNTARVREDIEKAPVWSSFQRAAVFTPLCIQLIRTGEMSGALDIMLETLPVITRSRPFSGQIIWRHFWSQCF
jgi:protein transport protein HofC